MVDQHGGQERRSARLQKRALRKLHTQTGTDFLTQVPETSFGLVNHGNTAQESPALLGDGNPKELEQAEYIRQYKEVSVTEINESNARIFESLIPPTKYEILELRCNDIIYQVSCSSICHVSDVIRAAVARWQSMDATNAKFDMSDEDPEIVEKLVNWIFTTAYSDGEVIVQDSDFFPKPRSIDMNDWIRDYVIPRAKIRKPATAIIFNTKMYILADKYNIKRLKTYASRRWIKAARHLWYSNEFFEAAYLLWEYTLEGDKLRKVIMDHVVKHLEAYEHDLELLYLVGEETRYCQGI